VNRLTGIDYPPGTPDVSFGYDANSNRTTMSDGTGSSGASYDDLNRLKTLTRGPDIFGYDYDAASNLTQRVYPGGAATAYTYDDNSRLQTVTPPGQPTLAYTYDAANRLTSSSTLGATTNYAYDGDGLRTRAATGPTPAQITTFAWDPNGALPELALERDGAGATLRRYSYGLERISMTSGGAEHYYRHDRLGSVTDVVGNLGTSEATYTYEPYGTPKTTTGTLTNPMGFAGQYTDPGGLQYLRARYYDTTTGRFLSRDPLEATTGEPYSYASNNPANLTDPTGLCPFCIAVVAAALVGATIDLGLQVFGNVTRGSGAFDDIDRGSVGLSGALGAVTGGLGHAVKVVRAARTLRAARFGDDFLPGLPSTASRPLGLGATGRSTPANLREQLAMTQVRAAPGGRVLPITMTDPRWTAAAGWVKVSQRVNGVEIHYVRNAITGAVDDFKFIGGAG